MARLSARRARTSMRLRAPDARDPRDRMTSRPDGLSFRDVVVARA